MYLKEMNCFVFVEQRPLVASSISNELIHELKQIGAVGTKKNETYFIMAGFIEVGDHLFVILPKGYKLYSAENDISDEIRVLFAVLMKYRKEAELEPEEMTLLGGDIGDFEDSLFAAYSLFEDYSMYGLLKREQKTMSSGMAGYTHWTATINRKTPIFSSGSPIYHEVIRRKNIQDNDNLLLQLHKFALGWSLRRYAWLFGQYKGSISEYSIELPCEEQQALHFLNSELRKTYVVREVNVIKWIINIITGISSKEDDTKVVILATKTFHTIWEAICGKIFCNQYVQLKSLLPQPEWVLDIPIPKKKISQRPDIVILYNNKLFILDAKYYDIENNLPGWHDAVKQFFYALSIKINIKKNLDKLPNEEIRKKARKVTEIENAFILPTCDDIQIKSIGSVAVKGISEFGKINAYALNTKLAMRCYIGEQRFPLINIINNMVS